MALGHWLKDYLGPKASGESGGESGGGRLTVYLSSSEGNKYQMYRDIHKETSMSIDELVQAANEDKTIVFQIPDGRYAGTVGEFLYTKDINGVVTATLIVGFGSALQAKLLLFRITWDSYENAMIARFAEVAYT